MSRIYHGGGFAAAITQGRWSRGVLATVLAVLALLVLPGLSLGGGFDPSMCDTTGGNDCGVGPVSPPAASSASDAESQVQKEAAYTEEEISAEAEDVLEGEGLGLNLEANAASSQPSISADGRYVTFRSAASNLVFDTNGVEDVFVRDRTDETTSLISLDSAYDQANGPSSQPSISADGRYVAFRSAASNLVGGDTNGAEDIFVYDRTSGTPSRISVDSAGAQANSQSSQPSISADGRYIVFRSAATNLVAGDTNAREDIFIRDRASGTTRRVSVDSAGAQANGSSSSPAISGDGGSVAFDSSASNLVAGDTNTTDDVFVRSLATNGTSRASVSSSGVQANGSSSDASISSDGRRVAFQSYAALDPGDQRNSDVYVRDRSANTTTWASEWGNSGWGSRNSFSPAISGDGRLVGFVLDSDAAVTDWNRTNDIYEYDLTSDSTAHISQDTVKGPGIDASESPSLSYDGIEAAFESLAANFGPDTNGVRDVVVHEWAGLLSEGADVPVTSASGAAALSTEEEQPLPRHCALKKPEIPDPPSGASPSTGSAGDQPALSWPPEDPPPPPGPEDLPLDPPDLPAPPGQKPPHSCTAEIASEPSSPRITLEDLVDKTEDQIRALARRLGLVEKRFRDGKPTLWRDPVTKKERLRIDRPHENNPWANARVPHVHGYTAPGRNGWAGNAIKQGNDPHIPIR